MKIVFGAEIWSKQSIGGISRYFNLLATNLMRIDSKLFVEIWRTNDSKNFFLENIPPEVKVRNEDFDSLDEGDIYHQTFFESARLERATLKRAIPVLTIYDMTSEILKTNKRIRFWRDEKRRCLNQSPNLIAISESTKKDLCTFFPNVESKPQVIYLGTDLHQKFNSESEFSNYCMNREPYFLHIGQRSGYKHFDIVLKALAKTTYSL